MVDEKLEKVIRTWEHMISHSDGKLSKGMEGIIVETLKQLWELRDLKAEGEVPAADVPAG